MLKNFFQSKFSFRLFFSYKHATRSPPFSSQMSRGLFSNKHRCRVDIEREKKIVKIIFAHFTNSQLIKSFRSKKTSSKRCFLLKKISKRERIFLLHWLAESVCEEFGREKEEKIFTVAFQISSVKRKIF